MSTRATVDARPLKITPNPAHGRLGITVPDGFDARLEVRLLTSDGRTVRNWLESNRPGLIELTLPTLPAGWYVLRVTDGSRLITGRAMIR